MSYENPQAVVDTESAKYFAQGLTNLGQNAVKIINAEGDRERAQAKAWKKQNLENTKNRIKFGSEYLSLVNKVLPDFDMATEISPQLNELIDHAADVKTRLGNMTQGNSGYAELKDELNALESYFSVGLKQGLENFSGQRQEYSAGQASIGSEMTMKDGNVTNLGLSASKNQPQGITDILSTMEGSALIPRRFAIKRFKGKDGKLGAYGTYGIFGEPSKEVKGVNIAARALGVDTSKLGARTYNFNTDFGGSSVITNPNITQTLNDLLESQKITKGDNLNYINGKPSQELQNLFEDQTVQDVTKTSVGTTTREMPVINYDRLKAKVSNGLESRVGGIVKAGQAIEGDLGIGMLRIQSYVDDILTDELDDFVGTLESDPSTKSGLTKDSYARLEEAIVKTKQENLSNGLVAISESETLNTPVDDRTADEKNVERRETAKSKEVDSLGETLSNKVIGSFSSVDSPAYKKLADYIDNIPGLTIDDAKIIRRGEQEGVRIIGPSDKILIHTGMSEAQIKKAIMIAIGAKKQQIEAFDFSPIDTVNPTDVLYKGLDLNLN